MGNKTKSRCPNSETIPNDILYCFFMIKLTKTEQNQPFLAEQLVVNISSQDIYNTSTIAVLRKENLIALLTKPTDQRTQKDIKQIAELLKAITYFKSIAKNMKLLLQIASWIQYKKTIQNHYLYKKGDMADCYYVVIKGTVHLTVVEHHTDNKETENKQDDQFFQNNEKDIITRTALPYPKLSVKSISFNQKQIKLARKDSHKTSIKSETMLTVPEQPNLEIEERVLRVVSEGQSFGDVGESTRRGTNAKVIEKTHLIVIRKQFYNKISKIYEQSQGKKKYQFLEKIPLLTMLYKYSLQSIIYGMEQQKTVYNSVIYNENDPIQYIYIPYQGEFKLYKKIQSKKQAISSRSNLTDVKEIYRPEKRIDLKEVSLGQILGYIEAFNDRQQYEESCFCKSQNGCMLKMQKGKFIKKILNNENNQDEIRKFIEAQTLLKAAYVQRILQVQQNDSTFIRFLHTPSSRTRIKSQTSSQRDQHSKKQHLRKESLSGRNFFNSLNKNVDKQVKIKRISNHRRIKTSQMIEEVPNSVKDIVEMVSQQVNYQKFRHQLEIPTLFDFNISKVPLHVKKKYDFLFRKTKK